MTVQAFPQRVAPVRELPPGGEAQQVLGKASPADFDVEWQTSAEAPPGVVQVGPGLWGTRDGAAPLVVYAGGVQSGGQDANGVSYVTHNLNLRFVQSLTVNHVYADSYNTTVELMPPAYWGASHFACRFQSPWAGMAAIIGFVLVGHQ